MSTPPAIPSSLIFSASSLQDYVDCTRRFMTPVEKNLPCETPLDKIAVSYYNIPSYT